MTRVLGSFELKAQSKAQWLVQVHGSSKALRANQANTLFAPVKQGWCILHSPSLPSSPYCCGAEPREPNQDVKYNHRGLGFKRITFLCSLKNTRLD